MPRRPAADRLRAALAIAAVAVPVAACSGPGPARPTAGGEGPGVRPVEGPLPPGMTAGQLLYVPIYSHVYTGNDSRPFLLAATLGIRNVDPGAAIVVTSVRYHDSAGKLVRDDLPRPIRLDPLATTEFFVREEDARGGSGASYLVEWSGPPGVAPPIVEAVMIGTASTQGISFVCPARVIRATP